MRIVSRAEASHELGLACDPRCLGAALDCSNPIPTSDTATVWSRTNIVPASPLPALGSTEELNVFGSRTGRMAHVEEGKELPGAPRGFTWRHVVPECC